MSRNFYIKIRFYRSKSFFKPIGWVSRVAPDLQIDLEVFGPQSAGGYDAFSLADTGDVLFMSLRVRSESCGNPSWGEREF
ncbi:MAG: hypothetical protein RIQ81_313 [Pseudomonadota bacterium]|jgi:hypothetical protein